MKQLSLATLCVFDYTPSAPRHSGQWASTARGWVVDSAHPHRDAWDGNKPIGNYIDYERDADRGREGPTVHVVYTPWTLDEVTGNYRRLPTRSTWVATPKDAVEWLHCCVASDRQVG